MICKKCKKNNSVINDVCEECASNNMRDNPVDSKYGPGDIVNIKVEIVKTIIEKLQSGKIVISYQVWDIKNKSYINSFTIRESAIQD